MERQSLYFWVKVEAGNSRSEFCMTFMVFLSSYWTAGNELVIVEISHLNT